MATWKEIREENFKSSDYVTIYIDGKAHLVDVKVSNTHEYDEYEVDYMFGYNGVTRVELTSQITITAAQIELIKNRLNKVHGLADDLYERGDCLKSNYYDGQAASLEYVLNLLHIEF